MTQLNTPYPSTAYLTGFLRSRGVDAVQEDLALALVLKLLSSTGLQSVFGQIETISNPSPVVSNFCEQYDKYVATIDRVIAFLQGGDPTLAHRIISRMFLPEGARFDTLDAYEDEDDGGDPLGWAFGALGVQDRARHYATLYLSDLADVLREAVDPRFEFVRYAESLAASQPTFDPLAEALIAPMNLVDTTLRDLTLAAISRHQPNVVLVSVPFPGNVYAAFRIAQAIKSKDAGIITILGGGFVNTELREMTEPRVFDYFDYITLDDGERPLVALLEHFRGERPRHQLVRTFVREENSTTSYSGAVQYINHQEPDVPFAEVGTPTWDGLPIDQYLSTLDMLNPMHRLWSDGRWNKLTVAHGCYWKKCSFCDVTLDYIGRYDGVAASTLVDRIESIIQETGQTGFHFVDEAAPPKALKAMAKELLRRNVTVSWWGNIRFEKSFTPELCELLADSGCIAISGGLEVASDRLLKLMKKGVSVDQVARVTRAFTDVGILVHAYLMYGFPTQTVQDTVDALEYVRQLFEEGCIQSGFFHRFTCTVHSPVGKKPEEYSIELAPLPAVSFAKNDIDFIDPTGVNHDSLGVGLNKALYNFMHGVGLDDDIRSWFEDRVPRSIVKRDFIAQALCKK
ncbi:B12-binding domain-containing radical SAM protein [Rubinisphaera italica]